MSVFAEFEAINLPSSEKDALESLNKDLEAKTNWNEVTLKPTAPSGMTTTMIRIVPDSHRVEFDKQVFDNATDKSRREVMSYFIRALQSSGVSDQSQQVIIDNLNARSPEISRMLIPMVMDSTSADIYTAMKWIGPFLPVVRVIFGVGAILVTLFLTASTIADLCFIGLPVAREAINNRQEQKGGGKIPFISADAISVVREIESSLDSSGGYKNAYVLYFKRRILTYIILSICLLYLVVGELGGLISWLLELGSGVV